MNEQSTPALTAGLSPRGFLSADDPLTRLPAAFDGWEQRAAELPKWLPTGRVRELLTPWPAFDVEALTGEAERERAMMLLSYLGHAWVWGEEPAAQSLPSFVHPAGQLSGVVHGVHCSTAERPVAPPYVPGGHGVSVAKFGQ